MSEKKLGVSDVINAIIVIAIAGFVVVNGENMELPDTASGLAEYFPILIGLLFGQLSSQFLTFLKKFGVSEDDVQRISGPLAETLSILLSIGVPVIVAYVMPSFDLMDDTGLWKLIMFVVGSYSGSNGNFILRKMAQTYGATEIEFIADEVITK